MNLANERLGVEFTTNEECQVIVIDYQGCMKVQAMFLDEHKHKMWTTWDKLEKGVLKNPFHKSVYGIGFLGTDENGQLPKASENGKSTREYDCWRSMLKRCYSGEYPTYENVTVCDRWHCFANFLEDLPLIKNYELWRDNPKQRIALNKDKYYAELGIITDCKEYNLLTTRFIPQSENSKEVHERRCK